MATADEDETLRVVTATNEASTLEAKETLAKINGALEGNEKARDKLNAIPKEQINATAGTKRVYAAASKDLYQQFQKLKKHQVKHGDDVKKPRWNSLLPVPVVPT